MVEEGEGVLGSLIRETIGSVEPDLMNLEIPELPTPLQEMRSWEESADAEIAPLEPQYILYPWDTEDDSTEGESDDARIQRLMASTPLYPQVIEALSDSPDDFRGRFRDVCRCVYVALRKRQRTQGHELSESWLRWYDALEREKVWLNLSEELCPSEEAQLGVSGEAKLEWLVAAEGSHYGRLWVPLLAWSVAFTDLQSAISSGHWLILPSLGTDAITKYRQLLDIWWDLVGLPLNDPTEAVWYPEQRTQSLPALEEFFRFGTDLFTKGLTDLCLLLHGAPHEVVAELCQEIERLEMELLPKLCLVKGASWVLEKRSRTKAKSEMKERKTMRNPFRCFLEMTGFKRLGYVLKGTSVEVLTVTEEQAKRLEAGHRPDDVIPGRDVGSVVVKLSQAQMELEKEDDRLWKASLSRPDHSICFHDDILHAERRPGIAHVAQNISRLVFVLRLQREGQKEPTTFAKVAPSPLFITSHAKEWQFKSLPLLLFCLAEPSSLRVGAPFPAAISYQQFREVAQKFIQSVVARASGRPISDIQLPFQGGFEEHLWKCLGRGPGDEESIVLEDLLADSRHERWRELYKGAETLGKSSFLNAWLANNRAEVERHAFNPGAQRGMPSHATSRKRLISTSP